jgi:NAD-reducing hydrogenase large subunit
VNKSLTAAERDELLQDADQMIAWSRDAVHLARRLHETNGSLYDEFGLFRSHLFSIVRADGALDLYDGAAPARRPRPDRPRRRPAPTTTHITEEVKPWSYMKFPFITELGAARAGTRSARWRGCRTATSSPARSPSRAPGLRRPRRGRAHPRPAGLPLGAHDRDAPRRRGDPRLLDDPDLLSDDRMAEGPARPRRRRHHRSPRGTLIHHYRVGDDDLVSYCNLIVSTTHNNQAMNEAVRQVARRYLDGRQLTEGLLNHIEVAIRAFDPCLSCATHALGKMPLAVELVDADGSLVDSATSGS